MLKLFNLSTIILATSCYSLYNKKTTLNQHEKQDKVGLAQTPPIGWNSFDSYGVYLHEQAAFENLKAMAKKLMPACYEDFVIDNGWFGEYKLKEGTIYANEKHASDVSIDEFGLLQPSKTYFPNGLKPIIDRTHELGLKFGLHLMRDIPRKAYKQNTKVKGTNLFAKDVANPKSICNWCDYNYGVDMSKPGSQDFYNSLVKQLAGRGVDLIKADDIVPYPDEVEALAKAIAQCGRPMTLSLSPGDKVDTNALQSFKKGNMLRVTPDIWDSQADIDKCFAAWRKWQGKEQPGFWIDMDMIPFGELLVMSPRPPGLTDEETDNIKIKVAKSKGTFKPDFALLAGRGWNRRSKLSKDQMYTFITMRALAASPLMIGGDLVTLDEFSLQLITNKQMITCNQNGVMGSLVYDKDGIEVWNTPKKGTDHGWIGVFNRNDRSTSVQLSLISLGTNNKAKNFKNIWEDKTVAMTASKAINANGVLFLKY